MVDRHCLRGDRRFRCSRSPTLAPLPSGLGGIVGDAVLSFPRHALGGNRLALALIGLFAIGAAILTLTGAAGYGFESEADIRRESREQSREFLPIRADLSSAKSARTKPHRGRAWLSAGHARRAFACWPDNPSLYAARLGAGADQRSRDDGGVQFSSRAASRGGAPELFSRTPTISISPRLNAASNPALRKRRRAPVPPRPRPPTNRVRPSARSKSSANA